MPQGWHFCQPSFGVKPQDIEQSTMTQVLKMTFTQITQFLTIF